jgi:hypothetical protein
MNVFQRQRTCTETAIGLGILLCLAAIVVVVLLAQRNFNPAVRVATRSWSAPAPGLTVPGERQRAQPGSAQVGFTAYAPAGVVEFGPVEEFDEDTLSDKINGKADLYLTSGFRRLRCQRFALAGGEDEWFEWFVYDMGTMPQAFAVYSIQRRPEAKPVELTEFAYATRNALYFVCGQFYVEAVAATPSAKLMEAVVAMARNYVAAIKPGRMHLAELELFPAEDMVPYSQTLQIATAFGFDGFNNIFTAKYNADGKQVLAYITVLAEPQQAATLAQDYYRFLIANGGRDVASADALSGVKMVSLLDSYEVVLSHGNIVGGVHAAQSKEVAERVALKLLKHLASKTGGQPN